MLADIIRNLRHIGIIQRSVHFVEDKERGRLVAVHGEEEGEGGHCLLAAGKVFHVAETFEGRHGVVFDAREVGLVFFFDVEVAVCFRREGKLVRDLAF